MAVHYVEIVSNDTEAVTEVYQRTHGLSFSSPEPDLGQARVATQPDGTLVGIRKPLAAHEQPIVRTYFAVQDIQEAARQAETSGATIAHGGSLAGLDRRWERASIACPFAEGQEKTSPSQRW